MNDIKIEAKNDYIVLGLVAYVCRKSKLNRLTVSYAYYNSPKTTPTRYTSPILANFFSLS